METAKLYDMNTSTPKKPLCLWIIVLHYGGPEFTRRCLNSLLSLSLTPSGIVLTDNCSPDSSGKQIAEDYPDIHFQQLKTNLGFAGGANAGVRYCIEQGADWVWLLNNDTEVDANSLERLVAQAEQHERAGALGALVYTPDKDRLVPSGTGTIDFLKAKTYERGTVDLNATTQPCQWISGCNLLLRSTAFEQLGGFDEDYFLYFEDVDLCHRLNNTGWNCLLVPSATIKHIGNVSTGENLAVWRSYYHTRNRLRFFMRHANQAAALLAFLIIASHVLRHCFVLPFRGTRGKRQLKAELSGLQDFLSGKFGQWQNLDS